MVVIKLDEPNFSAAGAELDAILPLDLGVRPLDRPYVPRVKSEVVGDEIVNSITIHKLYGEDDEEDVVAVLTNNDRTVRIYSLTHGKITTKLELPFATNHATISPDGSLLVAVGDYNQAYFYERTPLPFSPSKSPSTKCVSANSLWELISVVHLTRPTGRMSTLAYFSTAWSPSGALCAVASEAGYITILDTDIIRGSEWSEDAIVEVVPSTRASAEPGPGSIRAMCFSPQPWDLLIWAEDHGRVCVGDLRTGLKYRQVLTLDPEQEGVQRMSFDDSNNEIPLNEEVDRVRSYRRILGNEDGPRTSVMTDYVDVLRERRSLERLNELVGRATGDQSYGLSAEERQILEALRTTRARMEEERSADDNTRSTNYSASRTRSSLRSSSPGASVPTLPSSRQDLRNIYGSSESARTDADAISALLPQLGSLRELIYERNRLQRDRFLSLSRAEQRHRTTIALNSGNDVANETVSSASSTGTEDPWVTIQSALSRTPPTQPSPQTPSTNTLSPSSPTAHISSAQRAAQIARARARAQEVRDLTPNSASHHAQPYVDSRSLHLRMMGNPADGPRTTGLAMSPDGKRLFFGTEHGIWAWSLNWRNRGMWAAKDVR